MRAMKERGHGEPYGLGHPSLGREMLWVELKTDPLCVGGFFSEAV
jgi:hypothetical protein